MKYLHIKLCGKAFPHLDKVIKNKKKKSSSTLGWTSKSFSWEKNERQTDSHVISESSAESKARCRVLHITEKCTGVRVSLIWPALTRLSFIQSKSVWVQPSNVGNPSTNLFEPKDQRLEPCSTKSQMSVSSLRLLWIWGWLWCPPLHSPLFLSSHLPHVYLPFIYPVHLDWCLKAVSGFIYNKVPFLFTKYQLRAINVITLAVQKYLNSWADNPGVHHAHTHTACLLLFQHSDRC